VFPLITNISQVLVAHTCNPSYSGGRDQEDYGWKPTWANSLRDPISKKTLHKKGLVEWLRVYPLSSSPSTAKIIIIIIIITNMVSQKLVL
jgi:hypothetical protein